MSFSKILLETVENMARRNIFMEFNLANTVFIEKINDFLCKIIEQVQIQPGRTWHMSHPKKTQQVIGLNNYEDVGYYTYILTSYHHKMQPCSGM